MMPDSKDHTVPVRLKRRFSLHHGVAIIFSLIVGSGIWITPHYVYTLAGSPGLALVAVGVAGIIAVCGACSTAELGCTFSMSGDKYSYLNAMFGPYPAFLYLWMYLFLYRPSANAIKALTFSTYLIAMVMGGRCDVLPYSATVLLASLLLLLVGIVNLMKIQWAANTQNIFTVINISALLLISLIGIYWIAGGRAHPMSFEGSSTDTGSIILCIFNALFAFKGWGALNYVTEELKDPYRNLPRAIFIAMALVLPLYLVINAAYFLVLGRSGMSTTSVAVTFAEQTMGPAAWVVPLCIVINVASSVNASTLTGTRIMLVGARRKHLPFCLRLISVSYLSPSTSIVIQALLTVTVCCTVGMSSLMSNLMFAMTVFEGLTVAGLIYSRLTDKTLQRPLKLPLFLHILYFTMTAAIIFIPLVTAPMKTALGLVIIVFTATPYYLIVVVWRKIPASLNHFSDKLTVFLQKLLNSAVEEQDEAFL